MIADLGLTNDVDWRREGPTQLSLGWIKGCGGSCCTKSPKGPGVGLLHRRREPRCRRRGRGRAGWDAGCRRLQAATASAASRARRSGCLAERLGRVRRSESTESVCSGFPSCSQSQVGQRHGITGASGHQLGQRHGIRRARGQGARKGWSPIRWRCDLGQRLASRPGRRSESVEACVAVPAGARRCDKPRPPHARCSGASLPTQAVMEGSDASHTGQQDPSKAMPAPCPPARAGRGRRRRDSPRRSGPWPAGGARW